MIYFLSFLCVLALVCFSSLAYLIKQRSATPRFLVTYIRYFFKYPPPLERTLIYWPLFLLIFHRIFLSTYLIDLSSNLATVFSCETVRDRLAGDFGQTMFKCGDAMNNGAIIASSIALIIAVPMAIVNW